MLNWVKAVTQARNVSKEMGMVLRWIQREVFNKISLRGIGYEQHTREL